VTDDDPAVTSEQELVAELQDLLRRAESDGVDVRGGWECRNGASHPDWDVVITELEKPDR